ncbi:MAG: hypothetical protein CMO55_11945 [Verrucomicrobiales bacterium]|nr:hypothetical protein [Verrucomicrobiales bacterium]
MERSEFVSIRVPKRTDSETIQGGTAFQASSSKATKPHQNLKYLVAKSVSRETRDTGAPHIRNYRKMCYLTQWNGS